MNDTLWELYRDRCPWLTTTGHCYATKDSHILCNKALCAPYYWANEMDKEVRIDGSISRIRVGERR